MIDAIVEPLEPLLRELETFGRDHDARETQHARKMLNLDRETAELVYFLLRSTRRRAVLEIGTSNGYSTIWLAAAAKANGGSVISIDRSADKHAMAQTNLDRAGLRDAVQLVLGDATETIAGLHQRFDAVLFDADRISATAQIPLLESRTTPDALLLCDNVLSHPAEVADYLAAISAIDGMTALTIPVGKGLHVASILSRSRG